jgi:hypothetical protein
MSHLISSGPSSLEICRTRARGRRAKVRTRSRSWRRPEVEISSRVSISKAPLSPHRLMQRLRAARPAFGACAEQRDHWRMRNSRRQAAGVIPVRRRKDGVSSWSTSHPTASTVASLGQHLRACLAQPGGWRCVGAQAGAAVLAKILREGGFTRVRRATQTPFNMILEARP